MTSQPLSLLLAALHAANASIPFPIVNDMGDPLLLADAPYVAVGDTHFNTAVRVTSPTSSPYSGSALVLYNRQNLVTYANSKDVVFTLTPAEAAGGWSSIFAAFSSQLGTTFTDADYPAAPPTYKDGDTTVTGTIGPNSLLFIGDFSVTVETAPAG